MKPHIVKSWLAISALYGVLNEVNAQNVGVNTTGAAPDSKHLLEVLQTGTTDNSVGIYVKHSGADATKTLYGFQAIRDGVGLINIAAYLQAINGTSNYALIVPNGGGNVGFGISIPRAQLHIAAASGAITDVRMTSAGGAGFYPELIQEHYGGTHTTPTATQSGYILGRTVFGGYGATGATNNVAGMYARASENYTDAAYGSQLEFWTTPNGSITNTQRMTIANDGNVGIGTTTPTSPLHLYNTDGFSVPFHIQKVYSGGSAGLPTGLGGNTSAVFSTAGNSDTHITIGSLGNTASLYFNKYNEAYSNHGSINYNLASSYMIFKIASSEKLRIQSDGNVGVGITNPTAMFHVYNSSGKATLLQSVMTDVSQGIGNQLASTHTISTDIGVYHLYSAPVTNVTGGTASSSFGNLFQQYVNIQNSATLAQSHSVFSRHATLGASPTGTIGIMDDVSIYPITTQHTGTASLTISNHRGLYVGNMGAGGIGITTANAYGLYIESQTGATTSNYAIYSVGSTNYFGGNVGVGCLSPGQKLYVSGNIYATGTVLGSQAACSDVRWKKDFEPLNGALNSVLSLNGLYYNWKKEEFPEKEFSSRREIGLIAQEVEKIYPELIFTDEKGFKYLDYSHLTPVLIEAIKEQQKLIENQSVRINHLENENQSKVEKQDFDDLKNSNEELKAEISEIKAILNQNSKK